MKPKFLIQYGCGHQVEATTYEVRHHKVKRSHREFWYDMAEKFDKCIHCKVEEMDKIK